MEKEKLEFITVYAAKVYYRTIYTVRAEPNYDSHKSLKGEIILLDGKKVVITDEEAYMSLPKKYVSMNGYRCFSVKSFEQTENEEFPERDLPTLIDYKAKYEKCIEIIRRFDAGIIGLYDL